MIQAIIWDVDGTLAETEVQGHLPACNDAFAALGFPIQWSVEEFRALQHIPGNRHRMRMALECLDPPLSPEEIERAVKELFAFKQRRYIEHYVPQLVLRPGVRALVAEAVERGVRLAIVSTTDEPQIHALLAHHLPEFAAHFNPILGKLAGVKTAPDSPLHRRCLQTLKTPPANTLMIEDFEDGLLAARRAGLPCAVFYSDFTFGGNFTGAALVARSLEPFNLDLLDQLCMPR